MKIYELSTVGKMGYPIEKNVYYQKLEDAKKALKKIWKKFEKDEDTETIDWEDEDEMVFRANVYYSVGDGEWDVDYIYVGIQAVDVL